MRQRSSVSKGVGRKIFRGANGKKIRSKNSTIKPFSNLSVPCMKIQGVHSPLLPPTANARACIKDPTSEVEDLYRKISKFHLAKMPFIVQGSIWSWSALA